MLTGLRIGNFKAFAEEQHIPIRPITLVFGANSSGKSSIIHSLLLANHAMKTGAWDVHQPRLADQAVDLGGFPQFVYRQQRNCTVTLRYEFNLPSWNVVESQLMGGDEEMTPFRQLRSCGLTLEIANRRAAEDSQETEPALAIQAAHVHFNGDAALTFERVMGDLFHCRVAAAENPFLETLLRAMLDLSVQHAGSPVSVPDVEGGESKIKKVPSGFEMPEPARIPAALAVLRATFSQIMAKRDFRLRRGFESEPDLHWIEDCADRYDLPSDSDFTDEQREIIDGTVIGLCKEWYGRNIVEWLMVERGLKGPTDESEERMDQIGKEVAEKKGSEWVPRSQGQRRPDLEVEAQAVRINLCRLLKLLTLQASSALLRVQYLGPLRRVLPRHPGIAWSGAHEDEGGGLTEWRRVCEDSGARDTINKWLGAGWLGTTYRLNVRRWITDDPSAQEQLDPVFDDVDSGCRLSPHDLGFGVSQVLPVLVKAAAQKQRLIAVEQPELHLHPAQQAELGDVFIESALGERENMFVLETHSEHLILRIMKRIRQSYGGKLDKGLPTITPGDVSVLYVERVGNRSIVREFPLNEKGELVKAWPGGFFEEGLREVLG